MKAIVITQPGEPEVLRLQDRPVPEPGHEEILINVKAAGVNRADLLQRKGHYPPPPGVVADVPGLEVAGTVVKCGQGVTQWQEGDAVCALLAGGGYAEYVNVKEGQCLPVPKGFSFAEAAGLPETVFTVWSNVFQRGRLTRNENLLVHGGSSGIGFTAIQLARAFGAHVFVTVGSEEKGRACLELGAKQFINYKTQDFEEELAAEGMDVILDMIGGQYFEKNIQVLRPEGRLVYISTIKGNRGELNIMQVMQKRITITGSTLRSREYAYKQALAREVQQYVWPVILEGKYKTVICKTFPFSEASVAHQLMESSRHMGKIILINDR